ncbi:hypothetical protein KKH07_01730, partial [Patescibacteria group bacterium]|nr:hypothetical protein [Patescibacteria group bacterium]
MTQKNTSKDAYNNIYISLAEASKLCDYSQEYLSLRARQGKLKAIKQGRNWVTTKDWVEKYFQYFGEKSVEVSKEKAFSYPMAKCIRPSDSPNAVVDTDKKNVLRIPISDLTRPFFSFLGSILKIIPGIIPAVWGALSELFKSIWKGLSLIGSILPIIWYGLKDALKEIIDLSYSLIKEIKDFSKSKLEIKHSVNLKQITPFKIKIPEIPSFNIYQPKVVVVGILISSLVFGFFLAFNSGARASFVEWTDTSFNSLSRAGEGMANFIFDQSRDLIELTQTTSEKILETSSDVFNQTPQLIEEATQAIEELPIKIASLVQEKFKKATPQFVQGIRNLEVVVLETPQNISEKVYQKIIQWSESTTRFVQETSRDIDRWSQKNEQFKRDLKSGLAQLPQKIKELRVKTINGQDQTAEIIKSLPNTIKIFGNARLQDTRAWVYKIPEWTDRKISQAKNSALEVQDKGRSLLSKERLLSLSKDIFISSAESIAQGLTRFSGSMTATVDEVSSLRNETSQKVGGSVDEVVREIDKSLLGFVTVKNDVSASIFEKISDLNSELSQRIILATSITKEAYDGAIDSLKTTQSKLGDTYLKVAEFLIPRYDIDWGVTQVQQIVQESITKPIAQTVNQNITRQEITQITQVIESADLTDINNQIAELKTQIASKIDYTVPSYAPIYIPSSGLQVDGHSLLSTLNVSGSGSIGGSLSVRQNMSIGNTTDNITPTFTVNADSTFNNSLTANSIGITNGLSVGDDLSVGDALTVSGNSTLSTTTIADLTVTNDLIITNGNVGIGTTTPDYKLSVVGGMFASTTSNQLTLAYDLADSDYVTFSINSDGDLTIDLATTNATTTFSDNLKIDNNLEVFGALIQSGSSVSFATTTITGDFTVQNADGADHFYVQNNTGNMGIGTTTPKSLLTVDGSFAVGTNGIELIIDSSGNLTTTGYASTTAGLFTLGEIRTAGNLTSDGNFLVNGNATTTGSLNIDGDFLTDGTGSFALAKFTIDSSGNLITTGYASSTTGLFTQGNSHIGGTFSVDGATTLLGNLTQTGNLNITGYASTTAG